MELAMEEAAVLAMEERWAMGLWDHPKPGSPKWMAGVWVERRLLSERGDMPVRALWRMPVHLGNVYQALSLMLSALLALLLEEAWD